MTINFIHDLIEENGKSIKENNLEKKHNIPIGSLVEIVALEGYENVRLYVVFHGRDCDGTPLYCLAADKTDSVQIDPNRYNRKWESGFSKGSLKVLHRGRE